MLYLEAFKHPLLPDFLKGPITQESPSAFFLHNKECRDDLVPAQLPSSRFMLAGCPRCQNTNDVLHFTEMLKSIESVFKEEQVDLKNLKARVAPKTSTESFYFHAPLASKRLEFDPRWQSPQDPQANSSLHVSFNLRNPYPEELLKFKEETLSFIDIFWKELFLSLFQGKPFGNDQGEGSNIILVSRFTLERHLPEVAVSRLPLKVLFDKDESFTLVRVSKREAAAIKDALNNSTYSEFLALGSFTEDVTEDSFLEMWQLTLELLKNDSSMSINEALLSARLLASPES